MGKPEVHKIISKETFRNRKSRKQQVVMTALANMPKTSVRYPLGKAEKEWINMPDIEKRRLIKLLKDSGVMKFVDAAAASDGYPGSCYGLRRRRRRSSSRRRRRRSSPTRRRRSSSRRRRRSRSRRPGREMEVTMASTGSTARSKSRPPTPRS